MGEIKNHVSTFGKLFKRFVRSNRNETADKSPERLFLKDAGESSGTIYVSRSAKSKPCRLVRAVSHVVTLVSDEYVAGCFGSLFFSSKGK